MLQPVVRRTWAPRGQTPILRQWDRRDRLSTISAITVAPRRRRYGLYWAQYPHKIRGGEVLRFLQGLRRHLPHGFTLIWDRGQPYRAVQVKAWLTQRRRIVLEWLPAYADQTSIRSDVVVTVQLHPASQTTESSEAFLRKTVP